MYGGSGAIVRYPKPITQPGSNMVYAVVYIEFSLLSRIPQIALIQQKETTWIGCTPPLHSFLPTQPLSQKKSLLSSKPHNQKFLESESRDESPLIQTNPFPPSLPPCPHPSTPHKLPVIETQARSPHPPRAIPAPASIRCHAASCPDRRCGSDSSRGAISLLSGRDPDSVR